MLFINDPIFLSLAALEVYETVSIKFLTGYQTQII